MLLAFGGSHIDRVSPDSRRFGSFVANRSPLPSLSATSSSVAVGGPCSLSARLRGHIHISPFFARAGVRRRPLRPVIDCLEAIVREGNLNSRTTPQGSPPEAVRS